MTRSQVSALRVNVRQQLAARVESRANGGPDTQENETEVDKSEEEEDSDVNEEHRPLKRRRKKKPAVKAEAARQNGGDMPSFGGFVDLTSIQRGSDSE